MQNIMFYIVIPMAGEGRRFAEAGYSRPKPFINVNGMSMIERVMENLWCDHARFILLSRYEHLREEKRIIREIEQNYDVLIVPVHKVTEGMVSTILLAKELIDGENNIIIASCDQLIDIGIESFIKDAETRDLDGSLMTFYAKHPKWSYVRLGETGLACDVREKEVISTHANVGIYYFRRGKDFIEASFAMIEKNDRVNNEFYVAPTFNYLIAEGARVGIFEIQQSQMHGLGTPEDLEQFLAHSNNYSHY